MPDLLVGEEPVEREQPMRSPIRVRPSTDGDRMEAASRLNYGKMYTVEHNVRVYDFGMVRSSDIPILTGQWGQILGLSASHNQPQPTSGSEGSLYSPQQSLFSRSTAGTSYQHSGYHQSYSSSPPPVEPQPAPLPVQLPSFVDYGFAKERYTPPEGETRAIPLKKGDRLSIINWLSEDWGKAYNERSHTTGLVPYGYVTIYARFTALYTWEPDDPKNCVSLSKGDDLRLIEYPHTGWVSVWNRRTAEKGLVPTNYIQESSP